MKKITQWFICLALVALLVSAYKQGVLSFVLSEINYEVARYSDLDYRFFALILLIVLMSYSMGWVSTKIKSLQD